MSVINKNLENIFVFFFHFDSIHNNLKATLQYITVRLLGMRQHTLTQ